MKILLTGSNGFIGTHIKKELLYIPTLYTLNRKNSDFNFDLSKSIPEFNIDFEMVIHSSGKAHSSLKSDKDINDIINVNVNGILNLLTALSKNELPKKFILISSVSVYGMEQGFEILESSSLRPIDIYSKTKIDVEKIVLDWCEKNKIICTILRLPLVVGENPPGNLGKMIAAIKSGFYFNIAGGKAFKSMVLASDVAKYIIPASTVGGIYNLTDGTHPTFNSLSKCIGSQFGKSFIPNLPFFLALIIAKFGDLFGDNFILNSSKFKKITSSLTFNDQKARSSFGWNPTPVLKGFKLKQS